MAYEIRRPTPDEYAAVGEVTVSAYLADGFLSGPNAPYADHLRDVDSRDSGAELWVAAEVGAVLGAVLGAVTFCPVGSQWGELAGPGEGEFRMLAVDPAARGRGIGKALVYRCLQRSRELGYGTVVLSSLPEMTAAHRLYDRLGFARRPQLDWSPAPGVDLWAFGLELN